MKHRKHTRLAGLATAACLGLVSLFASTPAYAAFGLTNSGGYYTVDTGAGLVFKVNQANGDITSIKYNGTELNSQVKRSHIGSGLGTATVTATTYGTNYIKLTVSTSTLTHYLMVRNGYNNIYMATYITQEPGVGELRWITRLQSSVVPNGPVPSDNRGNTGAIESSDVFGLSNGQTRSKYYGNSRAMDLTIKGATGNGVGVFMHFGNRESASGGPFFRDIENQCGTEQEVYNYMNSGHNQTEAWRTNVLHGPYALLFTNGSTPSTSVDYNWIGTGGLNLTGYVANSGRGYVFGKAIGIPAGFQSVVGFSNASAQAWCRPDAATGNFSGPMLKPGTYTMTLYKGELAVGTDTVTIAAGSAISRNIRSAEVAPSTIWRIGEWDGTPSGFLNASNIPLMHPSDVRNVSWGPVTYTVGSSSTGSFPAAQWKNINNPTTIKFNLTSAQLANATLKIGLTGAYEGGRPQVKVNSWTSAIPSPSSQPDSRSLTIGTYRGNNVTYTYNIPASALVASTNTMTLTVVSGSGATGFLSAGYAYDCVELSSAVSALTKSGNGF